MTSFDESHKLQLEELYAKVHDERKCVTTKSLSLEMGIKRREAAALLEALPYFHSEHVSSTSSDIVYDVIRCVWDKDNSGKCGTFHSHDFFFQSILVQYHMDSRLLLLYYDNGESYSLTRSGKTPKK